MEGEQARERGRDTEREKDKERGGATPSALLKYPRQEGRTKEGGGTNGRGREREARHVEARHRACSREPLVTCLLPYYLRVLVYLVIYDSG